MDALLNNGFFPLFAVLVFIAIVLFLESLYSLWNSHQGPEAKKIEQRLRALSAASADTAITAVLKDRMLSEAPLAQRLLLMLPRVHHVDRVILQSGLTWTVAKLLSLTLLCGLMAYLLLTALRLPTHLEVSLSLAAMLLPWAYVQWKRRQRLQKMETLLPDSLDLIGRALRAGHALPSALKMAGDELPDPIAPEFRVTHDEINFGVSTQQALNNLCERVPITDMRYFVVAVLIQREAGGNLTEVLDNLSQLIRNRIKFHGKVRVLTTEGRMSAWVLGLLPFLLAGLINLVNPEFISVLWTDPIGIKITNVVLTMMAVGAVWLYKLARIRV